MIDKNKYFENELSSCPFCGIKPKYIIWKEGTTTFRNVINDGPKGYVLEIEHNDQCFIEHLPYAYYGTPEYCATEWERRFNKGNTEGKDNV